MTPKQAVRELNKMIDLTQKLGECATLSNCREWGKAENKYIYMNVLLNMSNKLKEVKNDYYVRVQNNS